MLGLGEVLDDVRDRRELVVALAPGLDVTLGFLLDLVAAGVTGQELRTRQQFLVALNLILWRVEDLIIIEAIRATELNLNILFKVKLLELQQLLLDLNMVELALPNGIRDLRMLGLEVKNQLAHRILVLLLEGRPHLNQFLNVVFKHFDLLLVEVDRAYQVLLGLE